MRYATRLLTLVALLMTLAVVTSAQNSEVSTRNLSAKATQTASQDSDVTIVAGCEKAAKEVVASRGAITHLERRVGDLEQALALEVLHKGIIVEQLEAKRTEVTELREALKAEREALAAERAASALKDARIAKLEKRGGSFKEKVITVAIGAAIGAVLN